MHFVRLQVIPRSLGTGSLRASVSGIGQPARDEATHGVFIVNDQHRTTRSLDLSITLYRHELPPRVLFQWLEIQDAREWTGETPCCQAPPASLAGALPLSLGF